MCEPIYDLPQKIDIKQIKEDKFKNAPKILTEKPDKNHKWTYALQTYFRVLPAFDTNERKRENLSMRQSEYLRCKFNAYINEPVHPPFKLELHFERNIQKPKPRRFTLNGKFYGNDNKLTPVPVTEDPRQYSKKRHLQ